MDIEERLSKDIEVFAEEAAQVDKDSSLARTLMALGIPHPDSSAAPETGGPAATSGRSPARGPENPFVRAITE